ncbi:endothelin-converting enzyme-like 1 [Bacillus rossius redtenbacheri]|uniref:endothelin-converting enzyme-like 1 n=1 Tax=Bacillus rossius redtenbacheri TaxID=93214 RepID=UPI002FDC86F1
MELSRAGTSAEAGGGADHRPTAAQEHQPAEAGSWLCCAPCHWLRRNNGVHKASLSVATLVVTSLLVASPVIFLISSAPGGGNRPGRCGRQDEDGCARGEAGGGAASAAAAAGDGGPGAACRSDACREAAARALAAAALTRDPCRDFHQFACGGGGGGGGGGEPGGGGASLATLQPHVDLQLQHLLEYETNDGLYYKLGVFYRSCLQMRKKSYSAKPMLALLDELGGYLPPGSATPKDLLTPLVAKLLQVDGTPLFDAYLDRDPRDALRLAAHVDLPRRRGHAARLMRAPLPRPLFDFISSLYPLWIFSSPDLERHKRNSNKESRAYTYMKVKMDMAEERRLLGMESLLRHFLPADMPPGTKAKEAQSILLFASMLSKIQWKALLDELFATNFTESDVVYVGAANYLESLQRLLSHFQQRVVHNALLAVYAADALQRLINASAAPDWPAFCARLTCGAFPRVASALYVRQFDPDHLQHLEAQVSAVFARVRAALLSRVRSLAWLDDATRASAVRQLESLGGQFSAWPSLSNETYVASLLRHVQVDDNDFFGNVIRRYRQLRKSVLPDFHSQPQDNQIRCLACLIPLAVLAQPHLAEGLPSYARYSTLGLVLAHEALHSLDPSRGWFTPGARLRLEARLDCVARRYSSGLARRVSFLGAPVDVQFDWNLTRDENVADVGGLEVAYQAWRASEEDPDEPGPDQRLPRVGLAKRQLFFLLAAQNYCSNLSPEDYILLVEMDFHTPYPERVNGMMMNSPSFADAYSCPLGSRMNPARKCSVW